MKIVILERNSVGADISVDCIRDFGEVTEYRNTVTAEEVRERVKEAEIVIANKSPLNEDTLQGAPNVKLICEFATGFDNCDLEYCSRRGIKVTNVRDYCTSMVAQHTFCLALALSEKLAYYDTYVKSGEYSAQDRFSNFDLPFYELEGKTWREAGQFQVKSIDLGKQKVQVFYSLIQINGARNHDKQQKFFPLVLEVIEMLTRF